MDYEKLKQRALAENDLMDTVNHFVRDDDQVYYADRHVLEYAGHDYDPHALDPTTIELGVQLGLDLLKHWSEQRKFVATLSVSEPFLCIDEEWLLGRQNPAPPYVYVCLAKTEEAFEPAPFEGSGHKELVVDGDIDLAGTEVVYVEGYDDPDEDEVLGAWLIRVVQGN
ncbi:hypothetical protein [Pelagibius sp.]|uniref:hypothetical protein n=1 Tax=Pelagibius sp. TaxID=1931238 RepID=UPI0026260387|nr:hypothetical protein [Pelagibius sp.]